MDQVTVSRELLRQVLDAFETYAKQYPHMWKGYLIDAEQALRTALEQPALEPVAWRGRLLGEDDWTLYVIDPTGGQGVDVVEPLFTAPQAQQPVHRVTWCDGCTPENCAGCVRV